MLVRADDYRPHVGTTFRVGPYGIDLEAVEAIDTPVTEGFSLLFAGSREYLLEQGIHGLEHPVLGALELFLAPVESLRPEVFTYQAIFNRMKPALSGGA